MQVFSSFHHPVAVEQGHRGAFDWLTFINANGDRLSVHMPEDVVRAMAKAFNQTVPVREQPPADYVLDPGPHNVAPVILDGTVAYRDGAF